MKSGNLRRLHVLYWAHQTKTDWENSRTKELRNFLLYGVPEFRPNDQFYLNMRDNLEYLFMNCNRNTEDYVRHRDKVEQLRPKKIRMEPLVYLELWKMNKDFTKEEFYSIDSDYMLNKVLRRIKEVLEDES